MATIDEVLSILLASQTIDELTEASNVQPTDWLVFFNVNTQQAEKILASKVLGVGGWIWIEGSWVEKGAGNTNLAVLQGGDIVWFKDVNFNGITITLQGWRFDSGDKGEQTSYTKVKQLA